MEVRNTSKSIANQNDSLKIAEQQAIIDKQKREIFQLRSIIKKLPGSVYWKDKDGVYLGCNDFVLDMAGTKDVIGKTDFDLPWHQQASQIRKIEQQVIETNTTIELEEYPTLANGQQIIILTSKTPLKDEQGNATGLISISVDITERKRLEAALKEASVLEVSDKEYEFYKVIDAVPASIYWKDKKGHYLGCNKYMLDMVGLNHLSEIIGKKDDQLVWSHIAERLLEVDQKVILNNISIEVEENPTLANKQEKIFLTTKTPLIGVTGEIRGLIGVSVDITERKRSEIALKEVKESEFYKIIDAVPASIYWKNKSGHYLGCNKYMLKMAGLSHTSEIIGKKDNELVWRYIAEKLFEVDQNVMLNNTSVEIEENPTLADKQEKTFLTTKTPLIGIAGEICGVIGVSVDITERKRSEIVLKEAKEKAEAADKAKTEFLENMRHDIRTPLIGITGFANIISDEVKDPKIKEYAENLVASSYALLDLLNEILEVIKVNAGDVPLLKKKFDLEKRLFDVIKLNQAKASQKHIDLIFDLDPNIPRYVIGDCTRIHRITLELIANALNFTDKGSVKLTTQLALSNGRDLVIKLIVQDTGIGIPLDKQQEIFLQFKRLTPSYEGVYKGAGLGLAIVKQFLDEIEGEIYVESKVGMGTKFTCILPLKRPLLDDEFGCEKIIPRIAARTCAIASRIQPAKKINAAEASSTKSRVLVVEDQAIASIVVKSMLSVLACEVDVATDGATAIRLIQENSYDLIFMDIGLPDMDGYKVTRRIRLYELNTGAHIPIIALTAHVDEENKQRCIEVGMNAILTKPLIKEKVEDILNAFVPYRSKSQEITAKLKLKNEVASTIIEGKIIDFHHATQQLGGNKEFVYEMLNLLVNSLPAELEELRSAYEKEDWESIQSIAHKLKGGSDYCGTMRLKEVCSRLEAAIKANKKKELIISLYKSLLSEIKAIDAIIKNKSY